MMQWVKHLPCKCEDPNGVPRTHVRLAVVVCLCNPSKMGGEDSPVQSQKLTDQLTWHMQAQQWESLSQTRWKARASTYDCLLTSTCALWPLFT